MQSKDILKNALLQYDGTLIIISHDRDFLQGLTNKVIEFKNKKTKEYLGDIYDFLEVRKLEHLKELEKAKAAGNYKSGKKSQNKIDWEQKKQIERDIRKIKNQIKKSEEQIEQLESEIEQKDNILANPGNYDKKMDFDQLAQEYESLKKELDLEMHNWESLQIQLEEIMND